MSGVLPAATAAVLRDGRRVTLRSAVASDAPALMALWRAVQEQGEGSTRTLAEFDALGLAYAKSSLDPPAGSIRIMADRGDGVVGEASLWRETAERLRHGATLGISVHPDWQGVGLGRWLMATALEWAGSPWAGLRRVELSVLAGNSRARALYEAFGFTVEGVRARAVRMSDGSYGDEVLMAAFAPFPRAAGSVGAS